MVSPESKVDNVKAKILMDFKEKAKESTKDLSETPNGLYYKQVRYE